MSVLLIAEHNNKDVKPFTLNAISAASQINEDVHVLVIGSNSDEVAKQISQVPNVKKVIHVNNPIYENGSVIGRATGGDYGFRLGKSIALGMVKPDLANVGQKLKVEILGKKHEATILEESPYDPENKLLRA